MDAADIVEIRRLISLCDRPTAARWLEGQLTAAAASTSAPAAAAGAGSCEHSLAAAPVPDSTTSTASPGGPDTVKAAEVVRPLSYQSVGGWGWEQNADFVEVTIFDGLEGVGSLPRDQIAVSFEASGFDLKVHGLRGKNLRLRVNNLEKDINVAASKLRITKNRITVQLKKAGSWEHWVNLTAKKPRGAAADAGKVGADPTAGLMDVMRDLYEDGDDTTRKVIVEAWTKSRDTQMRGVPSFPEGDAL